MEGVHIPVDIQEPNKEKKDQNNNRKHVGTMYFPQGTPASEVCRYVNQKQQSKTGIWLLQWRVTEPHDHAEVEDGNYVIIKDSKHRLEENKEYVVMYYNGPDVFLKM